MNTEETVRSLKAFAFDVDGVLFPNEIWWFSDGTFMKRRSMYDGQAISLLRAIGIEVALITSAKGEMAKPVEDLVAKWNMLPSSKSEANPDGWAHVRLYAGRQTLKKKETLLEWLGEIGVSPEECGAMGDDLVDAKMLQTVAFAAAPAQADEAIKNLCHYVAEHEGGNGAVRDVVNYILKVRSIDPMTLTLQ